MALADDACVDVTFEDPAEALQALRERLDCERAAQHAGGALLAEAQACVRSALAAAVAGAGSSGAAAAEEADDGGALAYASRRAWRSVRCGRLHAPLHQQGKHTCRHTL